MPYGQSTWTVYQCRWTLYKRPITLPESAWVAHKHQLRRCTGDAGLDRYSYRPDPVIARAQDNVEYTWQYNGVARRSQFFARSGENGAPGDHGRDGQPGRTGEVSIILGDRIPSEKLQDEQRFSQQNKQPYRIQIEQITRSGQAYPSGITREQVADRITPNPSLEYF